MRCRLSKKVPGGTDYGRRSSVLVKGEWVRADVNELWQVQGDEERESANKYPTNKMKNFSHLHYH